MRIEFMIHVPKQKNAHVSFPVGMVWSDDNGAANDNNEDSHCHNWSLQRTVTTPHQKKKLDGTIVHTNMPQMLPKHQCWKQEAEFQDILQTSCIGHYHRLLGNSLTDLDIKITGL